MASPQRGERDQRRPYCLHDLISIDLESAVLDPAEREGELTKPVAP